MDAAEAKERQREAGERGKEGGRGKKKTLPKKLGKVSHEGEAAEKAAKAAKLEPFYAAEAKERMAEGQKRGGQVAGRKEAAQPKKLGKAKHEGEAAAKAAVGRRNPLVKKLTKGFHTASRQGIRAREGKGYSKS